MNTSLLSYNIPPIEPNTVHVDGGVQYSLCTRCYTHWQHNADRTIKFISSATAATQDAWKGFEHRFDSRKTAVVVMDPWINCPDEFLNEYFGKVTDEKLLPFVLAAAESGHQIIVLSDSPDAPYNSKIPPELQAMVECGRAVLFVHGKTSIEDFREYAVSKGIENFIYTGFCSNICILYRELGIPNVKRLGIGETFFVPECSAAMEHGDTWQSGRVHEAATLIISQDAARLIKYEEIMRAIAK